MRFVDVIEKKAGGMALTQQEIHDMVSGYVDGEIPDYQMSAMMMAIRLNGMTPEETAALTLEMMHSGDVVDLSMLPGLKLDKHSTGGVGDTTTLVVAPLVAACGGTVAKMSGRGLGHTGGTLDKLESIPGCRIAVSMEQFCEIVQQNGLAVIGQTETLVPADKMMYALRDVTATVKSIPLIASSIMSKKLASGTDVIVLDVKTGSGAFMETLEDAKKLAEQMVDIGSRLGRRVSAIITDMNQPLGMAVGNALEVREAVQLLSGAVPETDPLYQVCMLLGVQLLLLSELADTEEQARKMLRQALDSGAGLEKLRTMVRLQGGDSSWLSPEKIDNLCAVHRKIELPAKDSGWVTSMNAAGIGTAAQLLGAGRAKKSDPIDPAVGLVMQVRCGDRVEAGQPLCTLYVNADSELEAVKHLLYQSIRIGTMPPRPAPIVYEIIG